MAEGRPKGSAERKAGPFEATVELKKYVLLPSELLWWLKEI
jgi:hypothetical protein